MKSEVRGETFGMVPRWVLSHRDLSATAVRLYGILAWRIGRDKEGALTHAWMSRETNCSVSGVRRALTELEKVGAVTTEPVYDRDHGGQIGNIYHVHFTSILSTPLFTGEQPPLVTGEHPKEPSDQRALDLPLAGASQREMYGAIADACGWDQTKPATKNGKAHLGSVAKQLREVGATVGDVAAFAEAYRAHWPGYDLTPGAMVKYWAFWRGGGMTPAQPRVNELDALLIAARKEKENGRSGGSGVGGTAVPVLPEHAAPAWDDR